jgi:hypothetical protein
MSNASTALMVIEPLEVIVERIIYYLIPRAERSDKSAHEDRINLAKAMATARIAYENIHGSTYGWTDYSVKAFKKDERTIRKLVAIGNATDPVRAVLEFRERERQRHKGRRAKTAAVRPAAKSSCKNNGKSLLQNVWY